MTHWDTEKATKQFLVLATENLEVILTGISWVTRDTGDKKI